MKANRLVLALVLAGLAAPAFSDEPIDVKPTGLQEVIISKSMDNSQSAAEGSGGPTIRSSKPKEIVVVGSKLEESTPSSLLLRTPLDAPAGLAAAPARPSAGGSGAGKVAVQDLNLTHYASPLVAPPPLRNERPTESLSLTSTKIERVAPALKPAAPVGPATRR